ncbi:hypothetical protein AgCh_023828 [Apium graveolens]
MNGEFLMGKLEPVCSLTLATFKVKREIENMVLKSAGSKWRQFKTDLTRKYVLPFIGENKKLSRPPKGYGYVSKATWKRSLNPGEEPDRAIFWQKARKQKNGQEVDEDLVVVCDKINALLEKKKKGEIQFSGAEDVLTTALESHEHFGRVRAVRGYITPKQ